MADSYSSSKIYPLHSKFTSKMQTNPSKSYPLFFFKSFIILSIIFFLPLFPSQSPKFLNNTILTKHWDLLHLLFIGILVSYGLFSTRRNASMNIETHSNINITQSFLSGISHVSSIFEDGFENNHGSGEKRGIHNWNNQYLYSESMRMFTNGSSVFKQYENSGFCSADHVFDQLPKPNTNSSVGYKGLGLPIRSLRSIVVDNDNLEPIKVGGSNSNLKGSCKGVGKFYKDEIRGLTPIDFEENFREIVAPSPIPWGSRSFKMENREEFGILETIPSHSRHFSVGEFESLKSKSFRTRKVPRTISKKSKASHTTYKDSSRMENRENLEIRRDTPYSRPFSVGEFNVESLTSQSYQLPEVPHTSSQGIKASHTISMDSFRMENSEELGIRKPTSSRSRPFSVGEFEFKSLESQSSNLLNAPRTLPKDSKASYTSSKDSFRMENNEQMGVLKPSPRPFSVGEFEFESLKSQSFWSPQVPHRSSKNPKALHTSSKDSLRMETREEFGILNQNDSHSRPFPHGEFDLESLKSESFQLPKASCTSSKDPKYSHTTFKDSFRMENREELGVLKFTPLHSKPFSVGEFEPESLKSQSFRLPKVPHTSCNDSKASQTSSKDSSSIFSSLSPVSPKLPTPNTEDENKFRNSHSIAPSETDAPLIRSNTRRYSNGGSSLEVNAKKGFKDNVKDFGKKKIGDCCSRGSDVVDSLNSDAKCDKSEAFSKGKSRGKSVRTIRPSETFLEAMETEQVCPIHLENKVETQFQKLDTISTEKQNLDNLSCESNLVFLKYQKGQRQVLGDGTIVESERESESDHEYLQASSDEEKCDMEPDSGEVDKKASEFIAMFKEQMRRQRVT